MRRQFAILCPILIVSTALAVAMLTKDHDWGDDFAQYIMQAISILGGTEREFMARTAFSLQHSSLYYGPIAAPWGFPALLAPLYLACGGLNILCLKFINVLFFALFLIAWFLFLTTRLSLFDSGLVASLLAFSPVLLAFQNNVLSDITFLFFSTVSILLIDKVIVATRKPEGSPGGNVAIGVATFLAFFVRPNGALLVPTLLLTQVALYFRHRSPEPISRGVLAVAVVPHVVFALLALVLLAIIPGGAVFDLTHFKTLTIEQLSENISAYIVLPSVFFWTLPFYDICYGALLPFLISGAVLNWKDDLHVLIYGSLTLLLFTVRPEQQGLRYMFPLLPFFVYLSYRGMRATAFALAEQYRRTGELLGRALWVAILASFVLTSFRLAHANLVEERGPKSGVFATASTEMFDAIKTHTTREDVIIFDKPRAMRLMTDRNALLIDRCDQLTEGNYVVLRKKSGAIAQVAPDTITTCNPSLDIHPIFSNAEYIVYRISAKLHSSSARLARDAYGEWMC